MFPPRTILVAPANIHDIENPISISREYTAKTALRTLVRRPQDWSRNRTYDDNRSF